MKERSVRVNLRIPPSVYNRALQMGERLGLNTNTECIKYFFQRGLEATAAHYLAVDAELRQKEQGELLKGIAEMAKAFIMAESVAVKGGGSISLDTIGNKLAPPQEKQQEEDKEDGDKMS